MENGVQIVVCYVCRKWESNSCGMGSDRVRWVFYSWLLDVIYVGCFRLELCWKVFRFVMSGIGCVVGGCLRDWEDWECVERRMMVVYVRVVSWLMCDGWKEGES